MDLSAASMLMSGQGENTIQYPDQVKEQFNNQDLQIQQNQIQDFQEQQQLNINQIQQPKQKELMPEEIIASVLNNPAMLDALKNKKSKLEYDIETKEREINTFLSRCTNLTPVLQEVADKLKNYKTLTPEELIEIGNTLKAEKQNQMNKLNKVVVDNLNLFREVFQQQ